MQRLSHVEDLERFAKEGKPPWLSQEEESKKE